jgi:predicted MPP superfamily phosphohydrolase
MSKFDNIFHLSDIHIRLTSRHVEYEKVFNRTYKKIKKLKTNKSLIVLTGDIVHSKNKLTPQCVDITYNFIKKLSKICHVVLILGNHDTNLKNKEEIDSLQVIVRNIKNLSYLRNTGSYVIGNITFGVSRLLGFIHFRPPK